MTGAVDTGAHNRHVHDVEHRLRPAGQILRTRVPGAVAGEDLAALPNIERKERLEALLGTAQPPLHVAEHVIGAGEKLFDAMCAAGQEGIISKTIDGAYSGRRGKSWVKVKCTRRQEFVIVGWKKSTARARPFSFQARQRAVRYAPMGYARLPGVFFPHL